METTIAIALIVGNCFFLLAHFRAAETAYGEGGGAFLLSALGLFFVVASFIALATVGASSFLGLLVALSAGLSALGFLLITMNASSAQG